MEETIETAVAPHIVWMAWKRGLDHKKNSQFRYKILEIKEGEGFSILWKTLFVRLVFTHSVEPTNRGSLIRYKVDIQGFFAWPVKLVLKSKIKKNLSHVLQSVVKELEAQNF